MNTDKKLLRAITGGLLASTLVFTIGASATFANEEDAGTEEQSSEIVVQEEATAVVETDVVEESGATVDEEATGEGEVDVEQSFPQDFGNVEEDIDTEDSSEVEETKTPSFREGFIGFVASIMENIRLALTFDEYKEAEYFAKKAEERIAEANALIAEGKNEEAVKLLGEAIEYQQDSEEKLAESESSDATETTELEETEEVEDVVSKDEEVVIEEEPETDEVKVKLANNIDALLAALAHVENPRAQEALMKNIEKSFAKLEKKLAKRAEKLAVEADETVAEDAEVELEEGTEEIESTEEETVVAEIEQADAENAEEIDTVVAKDEEEAETSVKQTGYEKAQVKKQEVAQKAAEKKLEVKAKVEEKKQQVAKKVEEKKVQAVEKRADQKEKKKSEDNN